MSHADYYRGVERAQQALAAAPADATAVRRAELVHEAMSGLLAQTSSAGQLACAAGCAHCCHFPVGVTFGEAHLLATAIAADAALRATFVRAAAAAAQRSWHELVGQPCPLLHAGRCGLYPERPLPCRAMASRDADACGAALHGGPTPPLDGEAFWRGLGAAAALAAAGPPPGTRELRAATMAVLEHLSAPLEERAAAFLAARAAPAE